MARGFERPPWWAVAVMVVAAVFLAVGVATSQEPTEPLSKAERERLAAAESAAAASEAAAEPPVAVFLGDSWVEGTGADTAQVMFAQQVADTFGWQLVNGGQGGTGYLDEGPPEFPERGPIGERVAETVAAGPDIVIVAAGINDTGDGYASEEVTAAVTGALQALRDQLPGVPVVVVGPWWPNGFPTESAEMVDRVVTDVATALGLPFVSPMAEQWITGSNDGTVPGNREEFIGPDGAHPSQAGHDYLAQKLVAWLQTVPGLPLGV